MYVHAWQPAVFKRDAPVPGVPLIMRGNEVPVRAVDNVDAARVAVFVVRGAVADHENGSGGIFDHGGESFRKWGKERGR